MSLKKKKISLALFPSYSSTLISMCFDIIIFIKISFFYIITIYIILFFLKIPTPIHIEKKSQTWYLEMSLNTEFMGFKEFYTVW